MEPGKPDDLIRKFYEGETNLQEEEELRRYFLLLEEVPDRYKDIRMQLGLYDNIRNLSSDDISVEMEGFIDRLDEPKTVSLRKQYIFRITAIAAGIALLAGLFFGLHNLRQQNREYAFEESFSDNPQLAYEETQKILLYVSGCLNEGFDELDNLKKLEEPSQKLRPLTKMEEELERLRILKELNNKELNK